MYWLGKQGSQDFQQISQNFSNKIDNFRSYEYYDANCV